jgi:DNA-binding MarR family transcriptional regulator
MRDERNAATIYAMVVETAARLKKGADSRLRERFGHSAARFELLSALARAGSEGLRAGVLTDRLGGSDGNTTQLVQPLVRLGMVEKTSDPEDGRVAIFSITRKGRAQFARMAEEHRRFVLERLDHLGQKDISLLFSALKSQERKGAPHDPRSVPAEAFPL